MYLAEKFQQYTNTLQFRTDILEMVQVTCDILPLQHKHDLTKFKHNSVTAKQNSFFPRSNSSINFLFLCLAPFKLRILYHGLNLVSCFAAV